MKVALSRKRLLGGESGAEMRVVRADEGRRDCAVHVDFGIGKVSHNCPDCWIGAADTADVWGVQTPFSHLALTERQWLGEPGG